MKPRHEKERVHRKAAHTVGEHRISLAFRPFSPVFKMHVQCPRALISTPETCTKSAGAQAILDRGFWRPPRSIVDLEARCSDERLLSSDCLAQAPCFSSTRRLNEPAISRNGCGHRATGRLQPPVLAAVDVRHTGQRALRPSKPCGPRSRRFAASPALRRTNRANCSSV
jgi:hypothetical protein